MVTDDLEQDVRGAQLFGMRTVLLRTGKFRPEELERSGRRARRGPQLDRATSRLDRPLAVTRVGVDLIEIARVRRALERYEGFRERCFTPAERRYCDSRRTRPRATRAASPARRPSARRSASASRALHRGRTSRSSAARSLGAALRARRRVGRAGRRRRDRPLDDALARARRRGRASSRDVRAALHGRGDARRAEEGHDSRAS